jgi:Cu-processing system ATP-binding protein
LLAEQCARGCAVLITSHILAELQQRVDRLSILANGRVLAQGSVQELREAAGAAPDRAIERHGGAVAGRARGGRAW